MNPELKRLILDICKKYPVIENSTGAALQTESNQYRIVMGYPPALDIIHSLFVYKKPDNKKIFADVNTDPDLKDIYTAMWAGYIETNGGHRGINRQR